MRPCPALGAFSFGATALGVVALGVVALGAVALPLATGPAMAQVVQNNPNAANESFALQSQFRTLQQQRTADFNLLNMQAQRNVQFAPSQEGFPGAYGPALRARHHGAGRTGRIGRPSPSHSFDMGICTGC